MAKTKGTRARDSRAGMAANLTRWIPCSIRSAAVLSSLPFAAFAAGPGGAGAALPTGGTVATGTAVISSPGAGALTVQQSSSSAILNWSSFSIGQGNKVTFDNGTGATLNRVSAGAPISELNGILSATGSVYLINPSGVIVGKSGVINVGGTFVASTQGITDGGFMAGGSLNFSGTSNAAVMNYGRIGALGGDVVLIASKVANQGTIDASKGAVGLLAGYQVLLKDQADSDGHFSVTMGGTGTSATNAGAISAAAVELRAEQGNIYALAGNTSGVIRATEVSGSGGDIRLLAPGGSVEVASGAVLDASAGTSGNGGHIQVDSADTTFAGTALARGGATGGDGGLIETSGTQVNFSGAHIDTTAAAGKTGEWLVDPTDLTIDTSNNATLSADLATTSVVLQTTATSASGGVGTQTTTANTKGDINIDAPVSWSSINTLGLEAYHSVYINAPVTISGAGANAGSLVMTTNAAATDGDLFFGGSGNVQFTGATNGLAGHVSLNGTGFMLETGVANLISAINANPAGNYALATSVTASGTLNGNQIAAPGHFVSLSSTFVGPAFTGTLEGLGNTITGLSINDNTGAGNGGSSQIFVGLIGYLASPGVVRDIGIASANVTSSSDSSSVGALVGYSTGSIINSWSSGTVSGNSVGGLLGSNGGGGLVKGSYSSASVSGRAVPSQDTIGGLVGVNGDSFSLSATITDSYATGTVNDNGAASAVVGGLVGWNGPFGNLGTVSQSYATGAVTATAAGGVAGGLAGINNDTIQDSYARGAVSDTNASGLAGGLVGDNELTITNAYSTGKVTGSALLGAAIGLDDGILNGGSVQNIYFDSTVNPALGGIGSNDGATVAGLSTASLQNGLPPSGFGAAWGVDPGFYPFLNFQYPHGAVEVSGTVFNGYDTSPVGAGLLVALSTFGTIESSAQTNASGAYALLADGDQQSEVLLSGDAIHANTYLGTPTTATTANLYAGYLRLPSASSSLSSTLAGVALAAGNESSRDLLYTAASGLSANTSVDILASGAFVIDTTLNAGSGTISINAGGAVTQTAVLTAASLDLLGAGASYSLTNSGNNIGTVAANTGAVTLADGSSLTVGVVNATTGIISTGAISLNSSGSSTNLTLVDAVSAGVGSNVVLAATGDFINNVGASAVSVSNGGRWLIYSALPGLTGGDTFGGLNSNNAAVWDTPAGGAVSASGDRYVFAFQPTLTFTSTNDSKTYGTDATTQIQSDFAVTGLQGGVANAYLGDTASAIFSGAPVLSSTGAAASAQVSGGPYTITVAQGSVTTLDGYVFGSANSGHLTIDPLALTASLVGNVTKTYDGTTDATLTGANYTLSSSIGDDIVSLVPVTAGTYDTKDAGTGKTVSVTGLTLIGANANDYTVASNLSGAIGVINPLALTASLTGTVSKTYDGTTNATLTSGNYILSGVVIGDSVGLNDPAAGTYDTKDVGTGKTVTVNGLSLAGPSAGDYTVASSLSGAIGVINPLALTASLTGTVSKTYDGTTNATLTSGNYVLSGVIIGDSVALNDPAAGIYDTKDAGTGKTVTVNGLALAGPTAGDYTVASSVSGAVGVINPLALTASLVGSVTKTYDGTTDATLSGANYTLSAPIGADVVSLVPVTAGTYDTKDAGTGKTVSVSGLVLTGAQANDYTVASDLSGAIGVINPLALTAGLTGTVSKTYDGTTVATLTGSNFTLSAAIVGDSVSVAPATSGTYDTKDVGTGKSVSVSGLTLTGADAEDYSLLTSSLSGNIGTITPLALTASLTGTVSKVYDGTTAATLTASNYLLGNAIAGDSVSLVPVISGTYDTKDVGTGKSVSVSGLALTGADANDYSLSSTSIAGNVGIITPLALTAVVVANNKTYDATTTDTGSAQLSAGVISGDQVSLSSGSYTFTDPNAGQNKTVSVAGVTLAGADSQNYSLSVPADATATITPRPITITADNVSKLLGQPDPALIFSITSGSLVGGTQVSGALTRAPGDSLGSYDITQGSLSLSSNYALSFVDGVFTISPAPASATPGVVAYAPANGVASNAFNGPAAFTFSGTGLGVSEAVAPSADTAGASSSLLPTSQSDDNSDTVYPDNRRISDNIRFSAAAKR